MSEPIPGDAVAQRLAAGAFVVVDKPRGPSSHQVTAWARDLLGVSAAGHAGTLDPNVSGVLWVGVGPALKLLPLVLTFPKRYVGVVTFHGTAAPSALEAALAEFTGPIYQTPPVRSAVKRERRVRTIHRLRLVERDASQAVLEIEAESGTYVRTLAVDLGEALGVGAHLTELRRTATGPFDERSAVPLTGLADAVAVARAGAPAALLRLLRPIAEVWKQFPVLVLKDGAASAVAHGAGLARAGILSMSKGFDRGAHVALVNRAGELVATGVTRLNAEETAGSREGWVIASTRVFVDPKRFPPSWHRTAPPTPPSVPDERR